jgi:uncharacterized membrane-anchored protein
MNITRVLIIAGAALVLGAVNYAIYGKERIIQSGESIYLELAPVDPRSLMQGDYMALRFRVADAIEGARRDEKLPLNARSVSLRVAENRVALLAEAGTPGTIPLAFRIRNGDVWIGTDAYFFSEGDAERFSQAAYGEFRIDTTSGEAVLVGLRDAALKEL